jgi:hypothetical protein
MHRWRVVIRAMTSLVYKLHEDGACLPGVLMQTWEAHTLSVDLSISTRYQFQRFKVSAED